MPSQTTSSEGLIGTSNPRSLYVHVPFCLHRCGYCDFTLVAGRDDLIPRYLEALESEIAASGLTGLTMDTVFLGGGTPTHLAANELRQLLSLLDRHFPRTSNAEVCVEANPAGLTDDVLSVLSDAGVNRISLGVQSFDNRHLQALERDHRNEDLRDSLPRVTKRFENVSFDLIFAVPGQAPDDWAACLQTALSFGPTHVSTYGLTFERGTAFWTRREKGRLQPVAEDDERDMYATAMNVLPAAGLEQYEISSFARPGFRCRHNQVYWTGQPYAGFGPGAASYLDHHRRLNHRSVTTWIKKTLSGESAVMDDEVLEPDDRARELLVLGLRRIDGVRPQAFEDQSGFTLEAIAGPVIDRLCRRGLLHRSAEIVRLTGEGCFFYDTIAGELLAS